MIPVYQFHTSFTLKRYTFLSIGKVHAYTETIDEKLVADMFEALEKLLDKDNQIGLIFTGTFLENLRHQSAIIKKIIAGVKKDRVILIGATYHSSLASLYSPGLFKEEIKRYRMLFEKVFDQTPNIFFNTAALYFDKLAAVYDELGINTTLVPASKWHLNGRNPNSVFQSKGKVKLILLAGPEENRVPYQIGSVDEGAAKGLSESETEEIYRVPQPIYSKMLVDGKTLSSNALQNALHQKIIYLKKKLKRKQRTDVYHSLAGFTSIDFFNMLTKTDDQNNRQPFESYTYLMNALTDFEWVNKI